ncbi:MFS transporter [Legionella jamestowniensis]|uniref:D-xylose proton symporter n=1 Tax=Legionella jamestowniensis TaxID=455 RepID=A0A0W0UNB6_9GAMM|nr:MFS transporter [Legionella jamestowniensis]KTD09371.1 D-xylose proton symporter [Legionella jamestowniensis]OCH99198.1 general substrate transporter [Legionella jamestowniensis]SFL88266.1 Predicted arabinose efflux permease, MFS family [Legionella jamestowniensis DSM 19215]
MDENKRLTTHVWIVCALGLFIDGYDLYITSVAEPFINALYHPSALMIGFTQAAAPLGAVFGAIIIGRLADAIGRKSMLILNLLFFVLIAILSACAWSITSLCVLRFFLGFGIGADYPICAAYLAEMIPENKKNQFIATAMFLNCLASPVGVITAWVLFKLYPYMDVWRLMFASGAIPALIGLLFRARLPESFLWKAHQQLKLASEKRFFLQYKKLFSKGMIKVTLYLCSCWFLLDISYYGIALFTPYVLQALNISIESNFSIAQTEVLKSTLLVNLFVSLGAFLVIFFVARVSLLKLQKIGFLLSFLGLFLLSISYVPGDASLIFIGFILFNFFINFGPGLTTYLLPARFYTPDCKGTGHGLTAGAGKFGAFLGTIVLPVLQVKVGIYLTTAILSGTLLLGWLLTQLLEKEHLKLEANAFSLETPTLSTA